MENILFHPSRKGGFEFTRAFYDLALPIKYKIITPLLESIDGATYERLVKAILQHSPASSKKAYPVMRERKQSKAAKEADILYAAQQGENLE